MHNEEFYEGTLGHVVYLYFKVSERNLAGWLELYENEDISLLNNHRP